MYNNIIDPYTGNHYNINSKKGKKILYDYVVSSINNKQIGGKGKKKKKKNKNKDSKGRTNPLVGMDPVSQVYDLYDNFEDMFNNGSHMLDISKKLFHIGTKSYCKISGKFTDNICNLKSDSNTCRLSNNFLNKIC